MKILIDNDHGLMTTGKRSPDGQFREPFYNREIARRVVADLRDRSLDAELLVPEEDDIPLEERVRRVNEICLTYEPSCPAPTGYPNVILVSIHVNAAGNGSKWYDATGWSVFTCSGQTESDRLAECLCESAIKNFPGRRIRTEMSDGDRDWEEDFYILRKSWCPAVLTENFFMDSHSDLEYLQSQAGKQAVVDTHVEGIVEYLLCSYSPD